MNYPAAVIEKAKRLEALLKKVEAGASLASANAELGLEVSEPRRQQLQGQWEAGGKSWEALLDGRYGHEQKVTSAMREWIYERKRENDWLTAGELVQMVHEHWGVQMEVGHMNYLLRKVGLTGPVGMSAADRRQAQARQESVAEQEEEDKEEAPEVVSDNAGLFFSGSRPTRDGAHRAGGSHAGSSR